MADEINISSKVLQSIIVEGDAQILVEQAEKLGAYLKRDLKTNQIRAIFSTVRQIDMSWQGDDTKNEHAQRRRLILLKPKMQFRVAKETNKGQGLKTLANILSEAIDLVVDTNAIDNRKRFAHFLDFFEAILAYHKVAGGKDS